jgi:L-amino acid N-acyltransferase
MNNSEITIRPATIADAAAVADIYNEAILATTATFDTEPKSVEDREKWLAEHGGRFPVLVAVLEDKVVGWASITRWSDRCAYADTGETSFYVHSSQRNRGIGRQLATAILEEARRGGFHTLIARIAEGSDSSLRLHESAGFVRAGTLRQVGRKFGKRLDVHMLQIILGDADTGNCAKG